MTTTSTTELASPARNDEEKEDEDEVDTSQPGDPARVKVVDTSQPGEPARVKVLPHLLHPKYRVYTSLKFLDGREKVVKLTSYYRPLGRLFNDLNMRVKYELFKENHQLYGMWGT